MSTKNDISLTRIYEAITKPNSSIANRCLRQVQSASTKQIDYTLRKLLSYSKHEQEKWSAKRLIHCLEYIYKNNIKLKHEERLVIASFKACVRWCLKILENSDLRDQIHNLEISSQIQSTVKFICTLLESTTHNDSLAVNDLITGIRHHRGVETLLYWLRSTVQSIQLYSVRALTAQVQSFAKDIIKLNGYNILAQLLSNIPNLLVTLSLTPPVTDAAQRHRELDHCVLICRLLDLTMKFDCSSSTPIPEKACTRFANTAESFADLARVWLSVCCSKFSFMMDKDKTTLLKLNNLKFLVYSLTSIIQYCTSNSKDASAHVAQDALRKQWQPLLAIMIQHWVRDTCCYNDTPPPNSPATEHDKSTIIKFLQISTHTLPFSDPMYVHQMILDLSNFLMAFVSQPILPEQAAVIGTTSLIHKNLRIDVEERGYRVTGEMLVANQTLLALSLESIIRHVQLVSTDFTQSISGHIAWCLKSLLTILLNTEMLETLGLDSRILKLIVFFLHYDDAIDILATCTTNISTYVWGPTIDMAKQGLLTAITLSPTIDMTPAQSSTIYKSKRAFVALQKISKHPRACERLVACDVLQLVNVELVSNNMEKTVSLYALFGQFVAALSRRTAFVRTRLRDECGLFPMINKLFQEAVAQREQNTVGWNRLISSCLLVISAFQYDDSSMRLWLASKESVLKCVLAVLFPWRNGGSDQEPDAHMVHKSLQVDFNVMMLAAQVLDQLSSIPACGRQMMMEKFAMPDLCTLLICGTGYCLCIETTDKDTTTPMVEDIEKGDLEQQESVVEETTTTTTDAQNASFEFRECLRRTVIRIFSSHENIQYIILSDTFTTFFRPLVYHPIKDTPHLSWIHKICVELHEKKLKDYLSLFNFTEFGEHATRLHEFTAIALTYLAIGTPDWNQLLGLTVLDGDIVSKKCIFSILCQMLVYGLEYEAEDTDILEQESEDVQALISTITPMRRNAAAQAIEALALIFETTWLQETESSYEAIGLNIEHVTIDKPSDTVRFSTEDAEPDAYISGNRQLLRSRSPIFQALLSDAYAESKQDVILLHDVTFHELEYFLEIMHELNEMAEREGDLLIVLSPYTTWDDIIGLLHTADRFGSVDVRNLCEQWVLLKVGYLSRSPKQRQEGLEGAIRLFRQCRDPIEKEGGIRSDTWPYARVLSESLKFITQYMSESSKTDEFLKMVEEGTVEELNAFCDGLACLLQIGYYDE